MMFKALTALQAAISGLNISESRAGADKALICACLKRQRQQPRLSSSSPTVVTKP